MNFLDYPVLLPDAKTIWYFRERLSKTGRDRIIWNELQRQLDAMGHQGQARINAGCNIHYIRSPTCEE